FNRSAYSALLRIDFNLATTNFSSCWCCKAVCFLNSSCIIIIVFYCKKVIFVGSFYSATQTAIQVGHGGKLLTSDGGEVKFALQYIKLCRNHFERVCHAIHEKGSGICCCLLKCVDTLGCNVLLLFQLLNLYYGIGDLSNRSQDCFSKCNNCILSFNSSYLILCTKFLMLE